MFQRRRAFVRMASVAAGASCLALAACSSAASSGGTPSSTGAAGAAPSATSTADPLASVSATQVAAEVMADAKTASSLTLVGSITQTDGTGETVNLAIKPSAGCTGTIGTTGKGSFKLTKIGDTTIESSTDLIRAVRSHDPGDSVTVTYTRDGKSTDVKVELGSFSDATRSAVPS